MVSISLVWLVFLLSFFTFRWVVYYLLNCTWLSYVSSNFSSIVSVWTGFIKWLSYVVFLYLEFAWSSEELLSLLLESVLLRLTLRVGDGGKSGFNFLVIFRSILISSGIGSSLGKRRSFFFFSLFFCFGGYYYSYCLIDFWEGSEVKIASLSNGESSFYTVYLTNIVFCLFTGLLLINGVSFESPSF